MRDAMRLDNGVLFYHSSCAGPDIVGATRVASTPYPDSTRIDPKSLKVKPSEPHWLRVDMQVLRKTRNLTLPELRAHAGLQGLVLLRKGNRLSITPVEAQHWQTAVKLLS